MTRAGVSLPFSVRRVEPGGADGTVSWIVIDRYNDRSSVQYRFLSQTRKKAWPSLDGTYITPGYAKKKRHSFRCNSMRESMCVGGAVGRRYWGVGIDNRHSCADCCRRCDGATYEFTFRGR